MMRLNVVAVTIWSIIIVMSVWDFVIGVLAGIVFCCTSAVLLRFL